MEVLRAAGEFTVDLVYPKRCAGCGRRGLWLCGACERELDCFVPPWCERCGVPLELVRCQCKRMSELLAVVRSVGPFDGWIRGAIIQFKYHGEWARAESLARPLAEVIGDITPHNHLVPVPLHPARIRQRGFNQSLLLAQNAATRLGCDVIEALVRTRSTTAQATLNAESRRSNVNGAFSVASAHSVSGRSLILIDDVITTGSTLAACAEVLLAAGAASVCAATVAREL